ncbi:venom phosphodiesterase-like [Ptychodera flava]|uniref:venom phosphodiesterase-like n=1 Tax=Ptychodera flava TaxID=63121 RepID=UPI00396A6BD3
MSDKGNIYTDIMIEDSMNSIYKPKSKRKRTILICILLVLASAGIGIGIGYAIFDSPTELPDEPGDNKPIIDYDSWLEAPCNENGEAQCPAGYTKRPLVILSLDGFRADYLDKGFTPNIAKIANCGVYAPSMRPVFPTYTFPNHYSIVTGLFRESHGIIANNMYDPEFNAVFSLGSDESRNSRWWGGEPIWVTAEKQGLPLCYLLLAGSDVEIGGVRPTYSFLYDGETSYEQRVDTVLSWISMPEEKRPDFITLYFDEPDYAGHDYGPYGGEVNEVLSRVDETVGELMDGMVKLGVHHCVDLIVLADHGMTELSCDKVFFMGDYIDTSDYYYRLGAISRLDPKSSAELSEPEEVVDAMQCKDHNVTPYVKWELPKNWHYANNRRIEEIVIVADDSWTISLKNDSSYSEQYCSGGTHGYDNKYTSMEALFMAHGPSFKQNLEIDTFLCLELYPLMADILDLEPAPSNATRGSLNHILRNPKPIEEPDMADFSPPSDCPFPTDYDQRIDIDMSNCTCKSLQNHTNKAIEEFDKQLDLSPSEMDTSMKNHAPFGIPLIIYNASASHCVLTQTNYVTGYNHDLKMPMWVSYTVEKQTERQHPSPPDNCVRPDVRVPTEHSPDCRFYETASDDNVTKSFLYPPGFGDSLEEQMDALIASNLVPQMRDFVSDIWSELGGKILSWADKYNGVNVISGPVFDYNYDSLPDSMDVMQQNGIMYGDLVIPTHYFVIVMRCTDDEPIGSCDDHGAETLSFIISNTDGIKTCQATERYLQTQLSNIRDIEIIADLYLLQDVPIEKSIALKNYLPVALWEE